MTQIKTQMDLDRDRFERSLLDDLKAAATVMARHHLEDEWGEERTKIAAERGDINLKFEFLPRINRE